MTSSNTTPPSPPGLQRRFVLLLVILAIGVAAILAFLAVLMQNYEVLEKGRLLPNTKGDIYKIRFLDRFTVYVDPENKPSDDAFNAYVLVGIAFISLTFAALHARLARDLTARPFWFFVLTCGGANYLAADEFLGIHETLGRNMPLLARLPGVELADDVIVLGYGIVAVIFLVVFRRVLMTSKRAIVLMGAAMACLAVAAVGDIVDAAFEEAFEMASSACLIASVTILGLELISSLVGEISRGPRSATTRP